MLEPLMYGGIGGANNGGWGGGGRGFPLVMLL